MATVGNMEQNAFSLPGTEYHSFLKTLHANIESLVQSKAQWDLLSRYESVLLGLLLSFQIVRVTDNALRSTRSVIRQHTHVMTLR